MTKKRRVSKAQVRASRNWEKDNPERARIMRYKSSAKLYVRKYADDEMMDELNFIYETENPNSKK